MPISFPASALHGVTAYRVDVEVDVSLGLPAYQLVGLPGMAVREGFSRLRAALKNCGVVLPARKITVNLAPADRPKTGAAFDLPIALGVFVGAELGYVPDALHGLLLQGELGLDGSVRGVAGVLPAALLARNLGLRGVVVPRACAAEAQLVPGLAVYAVDHLADVLAVARGERELTLFSPSPVATEASTPCLDFSDVRGQPLARRGAEIAVAGGHNMILLGPPGVGKTMIARRLPSILPVLSQEEALEVTQIYSAVGLAPASGVVAQPPFRAPHHTVRPASLLGGGNVPRPGEISLAHRGVLFLDEAPEFARQTLECLRQPLEEGSVTISRGRNSVSLPARFLLVAAANPCPCGWYGSTEKSCVCPSASLERYRSRLSGPWLDRIDLQVRVAPVSLLELRSGTDGGSSLEISQRIAAARAFALARGQSELNGRLEGKRLRRFAALTSGADLVLEKVAERFAPISARGIDKLVRVARTIADLENSLAVERTHVLEAVALRSMEREPLPDGTSSFLLTGTRKKGPAPVESPTLPAKDPDHVEPE